MGRTAATLTDATRQDETARAVCAQRTDESIGKRKEPTMRLTANIAYRGMRPATLEEAIEAVSAWRDYAGVSTDALQVVGPALVAGVFEVDAFEDLGRMLSTSTLQEVFERWSDDVGPIGDPLWTLDFEAAAPKVDVPRGTPIWTVHLECIGSSETSTLQSIHASLEGARRAQMAVIDAAWEEADGTVATQYDPECWVAQYAGVVIDSIQTPWGDEGESACWIQQDVLQP